MTITSKLSQMCEKFPKLEVPSHAKNIPTCQNHAWGSSSLFNQFCTYKQWRSQGGATGANAPDLVDSAPAPAPGPELLLAPRPAPGPELFLAPGPAPGS